MKKIIKRTIITIIAIFTLVGAGGTLAYASGYINWKGTPAFNQTKDNLLQVSTRINTIKTDRDNYKNQLDGKQGELESKQKEIEEKQKEVAEKNKEIERINKVVEAKQKEIEELKRNQSSKAELDQAYKDMKELEQLSSELLSEVGE